MYILFIQEYFNIENTFVDYFHFAYLLQLLTVVILVIRKN